MPHQRQAAEAPARRWYAFHLLTWLAVLVVGVSIVTNNLTFGRYRDAAVDGGTLQYWIITRSERGWPFSYLTKWHYQEYYHGDRDPCYSSEDSEGPTTNLKNPRTLALLGDIAFGVIVMVLTGVAVEHWIRHRHGRFQFSLMTLMGLTAIAAFVVAVLKHEGIEWKLLLYVPICFGIGCCAYVIGVWLATVTSRSDARLTRLRRRFQRL